MSIFFYRDEDFNKNCKNYMDTLFCIAVLTNSLLVFINAFMFTMIMCLSVNLSITCYCIWKAGSRLANIFVRWPFVKEIFVFYDRDFVISAKTYATIACFWVLIVAIYIVTLMYLINKRDKTFEAYDSLRIQEINYPKIKSLIKRCDLSVYLYFLIVIIDKYIGTTGKNAMTEVHKYENIVGVYLCWFERYEYNPRTLCIQIFPNLFQLIAIVLGYFIKLRSKKKEILLKVLVVINILLAIGASINTHYYMYRYEANLLQEAVYIIFKCFSQFSVGLFEYYSI